MQTSPCHFLADTADALLLKEYEWLPMLAPLLPCLHPHTNASVNRQSATPMYPDREVALTIALYLKAADRNTALTWSDAGVGGFPSTSVQIEPVACAIIRRGFDVASQLGSAVTFP